MVLTHKHFVGGVCLTLSLLVPSDMIAVAHAEKPAQTRSALTVEVIEPEKQNWPVTATANGILAPWQEAVISAEVGSLKITEILADVGDTVKKGEVLARLSQDSTRIALQRQKAELEEAKANYAMAKANADRAERVKNKGSLSEQQITEYLIAAQTAKAQLKAAEADLADTRLALDYTTVTAVDDGDITSRSAVLGQVVSIGDELFRMQRQGRIEWQAELDAKQLAKIVIGQMVSLTTPDGTAAQGTVRAISPALDATTGRGTVYVRLEKSPHIQAGNYVTGKIHISETPAVTLPESAVIYRDGRTYIFSVSEGNRARQHTVRIGRRLHDRVEILSELKDINRIVKSGGAFLSDNTAVTVTPREETP